MKSQVQIGDTLCTGWAECAKVTHIQDLTIHPGTPYLQPFVNNALIIIITMRITNKYDL